MASPKKLKKYNDDKTTKAVRTPNVLRSARATGIGRAVPYGGAAPGRVKSTAGLKNASTLAPGRAAASLPESGARGKAVISAGASGSANIARGNQGAVAGARGTSRAPGLARAGVGVAPAGTSRSSTSQAPVVAPRTTVPVAALKPATPAFSPPPAGPAAPAPAPVAVKAPTSSVGAVKPAPVLTSTAPTTKLSAPTTTLANTSGAKAEGGVDSIFTPLLTTTRKPPGRGALEY